jgi:2'-5' RNA ligase
MRLFIAIGFDETTVGKVLKQQDLLQENASKGTFTAQSNLHLTLLFLGELDTSFLPPIKNIMEEIEDSPFLVKFNHLGYFEKKQGDIWWVGIENESELFHLETPLSEKLTALGIPLESGTYHPHLTLGRNIRMTEAKKNALLQLPFPSFTAQVSSFSLMHSHRVDSLLTYSPIYTKVLTSC